MSLHDVLEEIRPGCTKRRKSKSEDSSTTSDGCVSIDTGVEDTTKRCSESDATYEIKTESTVEKKRTRRKSPSTQKKNAYGDRLYSSIVIGEINMDGYNLLPGEKLVIAKLTPIVACK